MLFCAVPLQLLPAAGGETDGGCTGVVGGPEVSSVANTAEQCKAVLLMQQMSVTLAALC